MSQRLLGLPAALALGMAIGITSNGPCPAQVPEVSAAQKKIEQALKSPTTVQFVETPLTDVVEYLGDSQKIRIQIDRKALAEVGIGTDTPVTQNLKGLPLSSVLRLMLRELDLTYVVEADFLLITTPEKAAAHVSTKSYPIEQLLGRTPGGGSATLCRAIINTITTCIAPATWQQVGGQGTVSANLRVRPKSLVVTQTQQVHDRIAELLGRLHRLAAARAASGTQRVGPKTGLTAAEKKLVEALDAPTTLAFIETPLQDVIDYLKDLHNIEIQVDRRALDDVGIGTATPITRNLRGISLRSALRLVLRDVALTSVIRDDVLLIVPGKEASKGRMSTWVYPVDDLVSKREMAAVRYLDCRALVKTITRNVAPHTWQEVGGRGAMSVISQGPARCLVVAQTYPVQESIGDVLAALRAADRKTGGDAQADDTQSQRIAAEEKIVEALKSPTSLEFIETPLQDVIDYLKDRHEIEIQIDRVAFDKAGIRSDTPITMNLSKVSLRAALHLMLRPITLAYSVQDEVLLITSSKEASRRTFTKVVPISDLGGPRVQPGARNHGSAVLINSITHCIAPGSWSRVGGPGTISAFSTGASEVLLIGQSGPIHEEIAELLDRLRSVGAKKPDATPPGHR